MAFKVSNTICKKCMTLKHPKIDNKDVSENILLKHLFYNEQTNYIKIILI